MDKNASKSEVESLSIAPEVAGLGAEERARLSEIKESLEAHVAYFVGREMWYQERLLQFQGTAHVSTDQWGARVRFVSENFRTLTLSGH